MPAPRRQQRDAARDIGRNIGHTAKGKLASFRDDALDDKLYR